MRDQMNQSINVGDSVLVDDPVGNDMWNHAFAGQVIGFRDAYTVQVVDGDGDVWDVEAGRLCVQD